MKVTLWKDNQRNEAKPFGESCIELVHNTSLRLSVEIGVPILPRFFLVTTQSGVKSMSLSLDGARERLVTHGHAVVECVTALWTYKYANGYTVTLRGPLTCHIVLGPPNTPGNGLPSQPAQQATQYSLKIEHLQFDANFHDKHISLDSVLGQRLMESPGAPRPRNALTPTANGTIAQQRAEEDRKWEEPRVIIDRASIPGEPVNAFGIPQATMRCLEVRAHGFDLPTSS
jgi:LIM-domain binding protein